MELAVVDRRRRLVPRLLTSTGLVLVAALTVALLVPPVLGLSRATVRDDAMLGSMSRGAAVFSEDLAVTDLGVGDVITYPVPSLDPAADARSVVTRRVVKIEGGLVWTRSDSTGEVDPWTVALDDAARARTVVGVPWVGHVYDALDRGRALVGRALSGLR